MQPKMKPVGHSHKLTKGSSYFYLKKKKSQSWVSEDSTVSDVLNLELTHFKNQESGRRAFSCVPPAERWPPRTLQHWTESTKDAGCPSPPCYKLPTHICFQPRVLESTVSFGKMGGGLLRDHRTAGNEQSCRPPTHCQAGCGFGAEPTWESGPGAMGLQNPGTDALPIS